MRTKRSFRKYLLRKKAKPRISKIGLFGWPDTMRVKIRYATKLLIVVPALSVGVYRFRGNSIYDPDYTSTGGFGYLYLEYGNFYQQYRVSGSALKITAYGSAGNNPVPITIVPSESQTISGAATFPRQKTKVLTDYSGPGGRIFMKHYATTKTMFNEERPIKDASYAGKCGSSATGTNPVNVWYWNIFLDNSFNSAQQEVQLYCNLTYYSEFFQRWYNVTGSTEPTVTEVGTPGAPVGAYDGYTRA